MSSAASTIIDPQTAHPASAVSVRPAVAIVVDNVAGAIPRPRPASDQVTDLVGVQACRCGHGVEAHEHFRSGSDCSGCGCARYRTTAGRASMLTTVLARGRR